MSVGSTVVRDGLVLYLDSYNIKSYPGNGNTWYDISGKSNHHTLVNSPIFNGQFTITETKGFTIDNIVTTNNNCTIVLYFKTSYNTKDLWLEGQTNDYFICSSNNNSNYIYSNAGSPSPSIDCELVTNPKTPIDYKDDKYHMWEAKNINFSNWTSMKWGFIPSTIRCIMVYNRSISPMESKRNYDFLRGRGGSYGENIVPVEEGNCFVKTLIFG